MNYNQITEKYHVLAPLERDGKQILLCRQIDGPDYAFFTNINNQYVFVDEQLEQELRKTYRPISDDVMFFTCSQKAEQYRDFLTPAMLKAERLITRLLQNTDILTKRMGLEKLATVKFKLFEEDEQNIGEIDPKYTPAYYKASEHTIYFANEESVKDFHILLHELIHATSKSNNYTTGLISLQAKSSYKAPDHQIIYKIGQGINEGATEFYASLALGEDPMAYHFAANIFANLRSVCNSKIIDMFFFTNRPEELKTHIATNFHYSNNRVVDKLFAQMDALLLSTHDDVPDSRKLSLDIELITKECYKTLIDMMVHKYQAENISLENKNLFEDFLVDYGIKEFPASIKAIRPELQIYFSFRQLGEIPLAYDEEFLMSACTLLLTKIADDKAITPSSFPENLRVPEFYHLLFSEWIAHNQKKGNFETIEVKTKAMKLLFSEPYLPKDNYAREDLVNMVLSNYAFYEISAHTFFPKDLLMSVLNKKPEYAAHCFLNNPMSFMPDLVCDLPAKAKCNKKFMNKFIALVKTYDSAKAFEILKNFYATLPPIAKTNPTMQDYLRNCLLEIMNEKNLDEVAEFITEMDKNTPTTAD